MFSCDKVFIFSSEEVSLYMPDDVKPLHNGVLRNFDDKGFNPMTKGDIKVDTLYYCISPVMWVEW